MEFNNKNLQIKSSKIANKHIVDNTQIVNYTCFCGKFFCFKEKILFILSCSHIVHETCFNKYILNSQYKKLGENNTDANSKSLKCPHCNLNIKCVLTENKINSKTKYAQYKTDIKSIRINNNAAINYLILPISTIKFTSFMNKLLLVDSEKDLLSTIEYALKAFNIKINIIDNTKHNPITFKNNTVGWKNTDDDNNKIVIISNHAHYLDPVILYYLFKCGFIASEFILGTDIGKIIASKLKLLIFKRGSDTNMVEKIKEYLDEMKRIVIFPEGALSNNDTLLRFRTGAFHAGASICPVVIKYNSMIYDDDFKQMMFKVISQPEIVADVYINDIFHGPFDQEKIDNVRNHMAKVGKLEKSRVSNKSIKE